MRLKYNQSDYDVFSQCKISGFKVWPTYLQVKIIVPLDQDDEAKCTVNQKQQLYTQNDNRLTT